MSYSIIIPKPVSKQLDRLPTSERQRILGALQNLSCEPRPDGVKKLQGYDATYRIRKGDYRIIYEIRDQELVILLLSIIHRKDAY